MTLLSPCLAAGCPELVDGDTYCARHRARNRAGAVPRGLTPCLVAGCPGFAEHGAYCRRHRHRGPQRQPGPNPWRNPYWRDTAHRYLREHPTCEYPDCDQPAALVHHRDGTGRRGARANNHADNLEALCYPHHGQRHRELHHAGVLELGPKR
jgi:hypothetical protein